MSTFSKGRKNGHKFFCRFCPETSFRNLELLRWHDRQAHTRIKPYACALCSYESFQKCTIVSHIKRRHKRSKASLVENAELLKAEADCLGFWLASETHQKLVKSAARQVRPPLPSTGVSWSRNLRPLESRTKRASTSSLSAQIIQKDLKQDTFFKLTLKRNTDGSFVCHLVPKVVL